MRRRHPQTVIAHACLQEECPFHFFHFSFLTRKRNCRETGRNSTSSHLDRVGRSLGADCRSERWRALASVDKRKRGTHHTHVYAHFVIVSFAVLSRVLFSVH